MPFKKNRKKVVFAYVEICVGQQSANSQIMKS